MLINPIPTTIYIIIEKHLVKLFAGCFFMNIFVDMKKKVAKWNESQRRAFGIC